MTWNILLVAPRRELTAAAYFIGRRVPVYCPTHQVQVRAAPNTGKPFRLVDRPLFPGYLFAKLDSGAAWKAMHETGGVNGYMTSGGAIATISEAAIAAVRQIENSLANIHPEHEFRRGDQVRVATEDEWCPWNGFEGVVQRLDKADRITISLISQQRALRVSVPTQWLQEVG